MLQVMLPAGTAGGEGERVGETVLIVPGKVCDSKGVDKSGVWELSGST